MKNLVAIAFLLVCIQSQAEVYKCKDSSGKTIYSDTLCEYGAKEARIAPPTSFDGNSNAANGNLEGRPQRDPKIASELSKLDRLEEEMLAQKRNTKFTINGLATWNAEMDSIRSQKRALLLAGSPSYSNDRNSINDRQRDPRVAVELAKLNIVEEEMLAKKRSTKFTVNGLAAWNTEMDSIRRQKTALLTGESSSESNNEARIRALEQNQKKSIDNFNINGRPCNRVGSQVTCF